MSDENNEDGGAAGATGAATGEGGAVPATSGAGSSQAISFADSKALQERLDRHSRKMLRDALGVDSPEAAKAMREKLSQYEKEDAERKAAAMGEVERAQAEAKAAQEATAKLRAELEAERLTNKINGVLHAKGVRNVEYARFLLDKKRAESGSSVDDFDLDAALTDAMGDPMTRTALGIAEETAGATPFVVPATSTPAAPERTPRPPTAGAGSTGSRSAKEMSKEEWSSWKKSQGLF